MEFYKAVPEGAFYQLEDLIFSSGISESVGVLVVDRSKLTKGATYLIPLQLEQSEDLETITSDTKKHYVILKYMFDMVDDKIDLTDKITDPLSCGANSLSFLYDDDTSTAYETKYQSASGNAQYGQPIDINLGKEMRAIMFEYITKGWNNSGPKVIKLFTSNDGTNWNEFVEINEGLPTSSEGGKTYTSKVFTSPNPFSYLRLTVMESYLGNCIGEFQPGSTSWYACWGMAELKLWGM